MHLNHGVGEDSWESFGQQEDPTSPSKRKSVLNIHWKDWCWNCNTLGTWCKELTHLKRHWCWVRLNAGREGDDRGWDGWMASPNQWTWVWVNSGGWWWTGKPDMLQSMGSQRFGHNWGTALNKHFLSLHQWVQLPFGCVTSRITHPIRYPIVAIPFLTQRWHRGGWWETWKGQDRFSLKCPKIPKWASISLKTRVSMTNKILT